jgi:hypothetical protein
MMMMVRLVSCGVRECKQAAVIDQERERQRDHHKQEKQASEKIEHNTYST